MAKGKSSATSATRKKHARKAAGDDDTISTPVVPSTKKIKVKKGEKPPPRIKQYIPPSKPTPVQFDPLDSLGLVHVLDKDLIVLLRRLAKKDPVTRAKAIEEIRVWVDDDQSSGSVDMVPVWLHHFPSLHIHPSRRIRLLAASLHDHLLDRPDIRSAIVFYIRETASASQSEAILGSWCLSSWDIDRSVSREASRSWSKTIRWKQGSTGSDPSMLALEDDGLAEGVANFTCESLLAPDSLYLAIFPPATQSIPPNLPSTRRLPGRQTTVFREPVEEESPRKSELDEENEDDRRARLRASSLGSLKWLLDSYRTVNTRPEFILKILQRLLSDPVTFSILHHSARPHFGDLGIESVAHGYNQPLVRRSAWALVQSLVNPCSGEPTLKPYLPNICAYILGSAWVEPDSTVRASMWVPLLMFLRDVPEAWTLAASWKPPINDQIYAKYSVTGDDGDGSGSSDDEEADQSSENPRETNQNEDTHRNEPLAPMDSWPYREFLQFLQLGCRGSPVQGYPTVVVILATIPPEVLPHSPMALGAMFASFWAAFDGRALSTSLEKERRDSVLAFLSALLECVVFYGHKLWKSPVSSGDLSHREYSTSVDTPGTTPASDSRHTALSLVREQWFRIWEVWTGAQLRIPGELFGVTLGKSLLRLCTIDEELYTVAWEPVSSIVLLSPGLTRDVEAVAAFSSIDDEFSRSPKDGERLRVMTYPIITNWIQIYVAQLSNPSVDGSSDMMGSAGVLVALLEKFRERVADNADIALILDGVMDDRVSILIQHLPPPSFISFFLAYAHLRPERAQNIWLTILREIGSAAISTNEPRVQLLSALLKDSRMPETLEANDELSDVVSLVLDKCLLEDQQFDTYVGLLSGLFRKADIYLNTEVLLAVRDRVRGAFKTQTEQLLRYRDTSLIPIRVYLTLMDQFPIRFKDEVFTSDVMPSMFLLAHLLIDGNQFPDDLAGATAAWNEWRANASSTISMVETSIRQTLKNCLIDTEMEVSPAVILDLASHIGGSVKLSNSLGAGVLPDRDYFDTVLSEFASFHPHASLSVLDPLVPTEIQSGKSRQIFSYDHHGLSAYARATLALHHAISRDRHSGLQNLWALRHLSALEIFARDFMAIPSLSNPLFAAQDVPASRLRVEEILDKAHQSILYMLSAVSGELSLSWHQALIASLRNVESKAPVRGQLAELVGVLYSKSILEGGALFPRILHIVVRGILREATSEEADLWLGLAQTIQDRAVQTAMAIVLCLTNLNLESPRLDRYRNELASRLSGVSPQKANTEGLKLLRLLDAAAPNAESGVIFLPTQRTVFMVQTFQKWVNGDDDMSEDIESQLASIFVHITPLLQSLPGSHWDLIADLVELNLESASFEDESLAVLHRTLRLVLEVDQLASSNKALRDVWSERQPGIYGLIKTLLVAPIDNLARSLPREACRGLVVSIAASASAALVDDDSFTSLPHLLKDTSVDVRLTAFQLMHDAAKKHTEKVVLETEVDTTGDAVPSLPNELMSVLEMSFASFEMPPSDVLSTDSMTLLLAWMLVFDLFVDATPRVKAGYIEQLRNTNIVELELLPFLFACLNVGSSRKPFSMDVWSVDEYHVSLYDDSLPSSLRILAAHVYYRSLMMVPSIVRTWWLECKDRQLSAAVASYTSQQFSPKIIDQQLANVKFPHILEELQSESLSIKTVAALHEIIITYLIDDQQMEIGLRFPPDYPLHGVEVKDMKRIGIQENKWRGWLFNVQQIAQNGLVVDALFWFKKNVTSYFEGKVECAICYSIISVMDRTLPTKPCKTCKNRFHAGCLYKWFHTSHSSSCPLCRSDIF